MRSWISQACGTTPVQMTERGLSFRLAGTGSGEGWGRGPLVFLHPEGTVEDQRGWKYLKAFSRLLSSTKNTGNCQSWVTCVYCSITTLGKHVKENALHKQAAARVTRVVTRHAGGDWDRVQQGPETFRVQLMSICKEKMKIRPKQRVEIKKKYFLELVFLGGLRGFALLIVTFFDFKTCLVTLVCLVGYTDIFSF